MAYEFNGTNQRLTTASAQATASPLTICCWFNAVNLTSSRALICSGTTNSNNRVALFLDTSGKIVAFAEKTQNGLATTANTITSNNWGHAAGVFSTQSYRVAYLNGTESTPNTTSIPNHDPFSYNAIGSQFSGGSWRSYFYGRIAEVGIWAAALTAAEIDSLAKGVTCDKIRPQNLVFYAPLVRDLNDQKGGLVITNNNGATVAPHPRIYP